VGPRHARRLCRLRVAFGPGACRAAFAPGYAPRSRRSGPQEKDPIMTEKTRTRILNTVECLGFCLGAIALALTFLTVIIGPDFLLPDTQTFAGLG